MLLQKKKSIVCHFINRAISNVSPSYKQHTTCTLHMECGSRALSQTWRMCGGIKVLGACSLSRCLFSQESPAGQWSVETVYLFAAPFNFKVKLLPDSVLCRCTRIDKLSCTIFPVSNALSASSYCGTGNKSKLTQPANMFESAWIQRKSKAIHSKSI